MGPITIFDKSAFQALSAREHVFVFKHLYSNITPALIYEVLGDLTKEVAAGRRPGDLPKLLTNREGWKLIPYYGSHAHPTFPAPLPPAQPNARLGRLVARSRLGGVRSHTRQTDVGRS